MDSVSSPTSSPSVVKPNGQNQVAKKKRGSGSLFKASKRTNSLLGVQVLSCGSYVPDLRVTNAELEQQYGFEEGWIEQRTGIRERRYAAADQATSDLCVEAAQRAIDSAGVNKEDVDLLLVGTFTPDFLCPSAACLVQEKMGLDVPAVDLQAACSGFMYALATGMQYVATGNSQLALVIGGDVNSRIVQPSDQRTAPLFGDGAGAVLLSRGADGSGGPMLVRPAGGTSLPSTSDNTDAGDHYLKMDGRNVFKWAVSAVMESIEMILAKSGMSASDVSLFVLHQANVRIIKHAMVNLGVPEDRVFCNLDVYGNTSGGSIPIALDEAVQQGRITRGDNVMLCGFGAGLTWGTGLYRW
ncbi:UNVERIFIED_CONTAM: hypothetical protein GTU68_032171 [Idotea baltica]|nr:hypothetical protein [Idotea baltica]